MAPSAPLPLATSPPSTPKVGDPEPLQSSNGHSSEHPARAPAGRDFKPVSILHSSKSPQAASERSHGTRGSDGQSNESGDGNAHTRQQSCPGDTNQHGRRSVQWNDIHGKELTQTWEFEASDSGDSDLDDDGDSSQSCSCVIQ